MLITLTPLDLSEVWRISRLRVDYCRQVKAGYTPYLVGDRLSFEVNSFGAEVAFCKMMDVKRIARQRIINNIGCGANRIGGIINKTAGNSQTIICEYRSSWWIAPPAWAISIWRIA